METITELWEVLVPAHDNTGKKIEVAHHQEWDDKVRKLIGGITILATAKGQWVNPTGELFVEPMIPVRLACIEDQAREVIDITMEHYDQEAVLAYRVSDLVIIKHAVS